MLRVGRRRRVETYPDPLRIPSCTDVYYRLLTILWWTNIAFGLFGFVRWGIYCVQWPLLAIALGVIAIAATRRYRSRSIGENAPSEAAVARLLTSAGASLQDIEIREGTRGDFAACESGGKLWCLYPKSVSDLVLLEHAPVESEVRWNRCECLLLHEFWHLRSGDTRRFWEAIERTILSGAVTLGAVLSLRFGEPDAASYIAGTAIYCGMVYATMCLTLLAVARSREFVADAGAAAQMGVDRVREAFRTLATLESRTRSSLWSRWTHPDWKTRLRRIDDPTSVYDSGVADHALLGTVFALSQIALTFIHSIAQQIEAPALIATAGRVIILVGWWNLIGVATIALIIPAAIIDRTRWRALPKSIVAFALSSRCVAEAAIWLLRMSAPEGNETTFAFRLGSTVLIVGCLQTAAFVASREWLRHRGRKPSPSITLHSTMLASAAAGLPVSFALVVAIDKIVATVGGYSNSPSTLGVFVAFVAALTCVGGTLWLVWPQCVRAMSRKADPNAVVGPSRFMHDEWANSLA